MVRLSEGVEWGVHVAVLLAAVPPGGALPATKLAEYHGVPGPYLAKHLQAMSRAGVVDSIPGPRGGYRLARPATELTVLDVVRAIDGVESAFRCTEIRQRGPAGAPPRVYRRPCAVHATMQRAEAAWRDALSATTIADLLAEVLEHAPRASLQRGVEWLTDAVRTS